MAFISGVGNNSGSANIFSYLSGTLGKSKNDALGTNFYADYASIKNGSYMKLAKQYYKNNAGETVNTDNDSTKAAKEAYAREKDSATDLKASLRELSNSSLYQKSKKVTDESGNETNEYDKDAIVKALKNYTEKYNSVIENGGESEAKGVISATYSIVQSTKSNANLLSKIGITIGSDNKLSFDENSIDASTIGSVRTLFEGYGSYGDRISDKTAEIEKSAVKASANVVSYSSNGNYDLYGLQGNNYESYYWQIIVVRILWLSGLP